MRRLIHLIAALGIALTLSALWLIASPDSACAESGRIVVLSGQDLKTYQDVLAGLQQSLTKQGINLAVEIHAAQGAPSTANVLADIGKNGARLVVTLGSAATQAAVREVGQVPILATMIVTADDIKSASNATAVLLDFPLDLQMQWLHRIVPAANTVGVLFNPKKPDQGEPCSPHRQRKRPESCDTSGGHTSRPPRRIGNLSRHVDALWGISDSVVMTPQTAEPILLSTFGTRYRSQDCPRHGSGRRTVCARSGLPRHRKPMRNIAGKILRGPVPRPLRRYFPAK